MVLYVEGRTGKKDGEKGRGKREGTYDADTSTEDLGWEVHAEFQFDWASASMGTGKMPTKMNAYISSPTRKTEI